MFNKFWSPKGRLIWSAFWAGIALVFFILACLQNNIGIAIMQAAFFLLSSFILVRKLIKI